MGVILLPDPVHFLFSCDCTSVVRNHHVSSDNPGIKSVNKQFNNNLQDMTIESANESHLDSGATAEW